MVKLLFCGDVHGNWTLLLERLNDLQKSQHGPFDILFLTGSCFQDEEEVQNLRSNVVLPLKTYCFDCPSYISKYELPVNLEVIGAGRRCGIVNLQHNLTVCYQGSLSSSSNSDMTDLENVRSVVSGVGYRGCDICITAEWPKDMHHFLEEADMNEFKSTNIGIGVGSREASAFAMLVRPRYHFVTGMGSFYQRSPYSIPTGRVIGALGINTSTRLLSIGQVSSTKEKSKKWLHALSIRPIIHLSAAELLETPPGTTDCPYVDIGSGAGSVVNNGNATGWKNPFVTSTAGAGADDHAAKRMRVDATGKSFVPPLPPGAPPAAGAAGSFFFGNMGVPRGGSGGGGAGLNLVAPSDKACTLFIGGLLRTMQDSDLEGAFGGVKFVKRPPGKAFAFVEFVSHDAARSVVESSARRGTVVQGRTLTVGWAKEKESQPTSEDGAFGANIERQLVPPSEDAKTLFIGGLGQFDANAVADVPADVSPFQHALNQLLPGVVSVNKPTGKSYAFVDFESYDAAMAVVTKSINEPRAMVLQGAPLVIGWAKGDVHTADGKLRLMLEPPSSTSQVLFVGNLPADATEEAVSALFTGCKVLTVKRPEGRDYAFVEFATPADAQKGMALSASTELSLSDCVLQVGWAKGQAADKSNQSAECWFCLASPVVKIHLIVSVGEHSYLALPRGGVTSKHVLISPIDCVPSRVHLSAAAKAEMVRFQNCVEDMFHALGCVSLRFERALRTKGSRDHMQAHMIPMPLSASQLSKSFSVFLQKASASQLKFHEIQDEQSIDEVVVSMEGGPYQEYFYIEIPVSAGDAPTTASAGDAATGGPLSSRAKAERGRHRRFVYVQEEGASKFPMQFGLEVAAEILGQPERGHWKHCLLPETEEARLCDEFREALAPYDFTVVA